MPSPNVNYSVAQVNEAFNKALNPDATPTEDSNALITSGGVKSATVPVVGKGVNLLDNWYFVGGGSQQGGGQFPINQRGLTTYNTLNAYSIDRWKLVLGSITLNQGYLALSSSCVLDQSFEYGLPHIPMTVSALLDGGGFATATFTPTGAEIGYFPMGSGMNVKVFNNDKTIRLYAESAVNVVAFKLELGDTETLAHQENGTWVLNDPPPNYVEELYKCRRYYRVMRAVYCFTGQSSYMQYPALLEPPMRTGLSSSNTSFKSYNGTANTLTTPEGADSGAITNIYPTDGDMIPTIKLASAPQYTMLGCKVTIECDL